MACFPRGEGIGVQEATNKAATLIEALDYIQRYHGRIVMVKLGGSVMDSPETERLLLQDIVFLRYVGMRPVLVHGGGKEISAAMDEAGLEPHFIQGQRYTDERTLAIVEQVLCGRINRRLVETLESLGVEAIGLHSLSSCVLFAERTYEQSPDGHRIDLGHVGRITSVNAKVIHLLCEAGTIPVIAPVARDAAGGKLNINGDIAAGEVAAALPAEKLVMMSDTHGIRADLADEESYYRSLNRAQIATFMADGVIGKGMVPKVRACLRALDAGVKKTHIIDGRKDHSLLLEIFSHSGVGTEIVVDE